MKSVFEKSTILKLERLKREDTAQLIMSVTNSKIVGTNLLTFIQSRSDGIVCKTTNFIA